MGGVMGAKRGAAALILAVTALMLSIFAYGYECARDLEVTTIVLDSRCDLVVAQLSDLHFPSNGPSVDAILEVLKGVDPQIVMLTGDYISSISGINELRDFVCRLRSELPQTYVFACLGNWDYEDYAKPLVVRALESCGVTVLVNSFKLVHVGRCLVVVAGLDDGIYGRPSMSVVEKVVEARSDVRILLVHEPQLALEAVAHGFRGIVFAGHCHGGQIQLLGHPLMLPEMCPRNLFQGVHAISGALVVVSRGIGTSHLPIRIGAMPQIIVLKLVNGGGAH